MNSTIIPTFGIENIFNDSTSSLDRLFANNRPEGPSFMVIAFVIIVFVMLYYAFSSVGLTAGSSSSSGYGFSEAFDLGSGSSSSSTIGANPMVRMIEILFWGTFIFLLLINGLEYFFQIDVKAEIKNLFTEPEIDVKVIEDSVQQVMAPPKPKEEVFHIPGNEYSYDDAKALCKAYGARLATYDEVENSYSKGGEWCSYGWSDKQLALYPTQKNTYDKLQQIEGHEHDCGRPGINGGYISNKNVQFGVNCYGRKPKINEEESRLMKETKPYPVTKKDKEMDKRIEYFRKKLPDIIVAPFNKKSWERV
jgi:hypothetical protein